MKTHIQKVVHCSIICSEKTPEYYLNVQIKDISWINYSTHTMQLLKKQWERYLCDMQIFPGWFLVEKKKNFDFIFEWKKNQSEVILAWGFWFWGGVVK